MFYARRTSNFDDYSKYWGLFGPVVGVATGAIPSYFFKTQADRAADRAHVANQKAQLYAGQLDPAAARDIQKSHRDLFAAVPNAEKEDGP